MAKDIDPKTEACARDRELDKLLNEKPYRGSAMHRDTPIGETPTRGVGLDSAGQDRADATAYTFLGGQAREGDKPGGGSKQDVGKIQLFKGVFDYFPLALKQVALVSEYGAAKYDWKGWENVPDGEARYMEGLCRHLLALSEEGEFDITDSNLPHRAQLAWNALAVLELSLRNDTIPLTRQTYTTPKADQWPVAWLTAPRMEDYTHNTVTVIDKATKVPFSDGHKMMYVDDVEVEDVPVVDPFAAATARSEVKEELIGALATLSVQERFDIYAAASRIASNAKGS